MTPLKRGQKTLPKRNIDCFIAKIRYYPKTEAKIFARILRLDKTCRAKYITRGWQPRIYERGITQYKRKILAKIILLIFFADLPDTDIAIAKISFQNRLYCYSHRPFEEHTLKIFAL